MTEPQTSPARSRLLLPEPIGTATVALIAVVLMTCVVAGIHALIGLREFRATSDNALNEMVIRGLGHDIALLGPYSRSGWSHPGPLLYYLLWAPYRVFGSNGAALLVGAALINGAAIGTMIAIAKRWGGALFAIPVALACSWLLVRLPAGFVQDPWNPFITVFPIGAFLLLAWASTCGDRWALPVAAFVGTLCVQTHVGNAALVASIMAWCLWRAVRDRDVRDRDRPRRTEAGAQGLAAVWWTAGVLAILWALPIFQELTRDPGNLRSIFRFFRAPPEPVHSLVDAFRVIAAQFSVDPDWIFGLRNVTRTAEVGALFKRSIPVPVLLVPFGIAAVAVLRRGNLAARRLVVILIAALIVGTVATARTSGLMHEYRLRWVWLLAALCMAFTVAVLGRWLSRYVPRRVGVVAGAAAVVVLSSVAGVNVVRADPPLAENARQTAELARRTIRNLPPGPGVVWVEGTYFSTMTNLPGFILALERAGIPVKVNDTFDRRLTYGDKRVYRGEPIRARVLLAADDGIDRLGRYPGSRELAFVSDVSHHAWDRSMREYAALRARPEVVVARPELVERLNREIKAVAVFQVPNGPPIAQPARP